jgi:uncharacterized protein (TIGR03437 family)
MLPPQWKTALAATLCAAACSPLAVAQATPPAILRIDTTNVVLYTEYASDPSKFATDPNVAAATTPSGGTFTRTLAIGDIVAVNGQPVMGTHTRGAIGNLRLNTVPSPGVAIADTPRAAVAVFTFEILKRDGTPIGTIVATGLAGGGAPPGSPLAVNGGNNFVIAGGTGAFLGARGQLGAVAPPPGVAAQRGASMTEDPANRRLNGGGTQQWVAHLIPMSVPQIFTTAGRPALFHSDFSPVTLANPAKAGEVLIAQASGLGPTMPGVDPGQPFPTDATLQVNSPVAAIVNGRDAEVVNAVAWPGTVDTYRVDFRVPEGTAAGMVSLQLSATWIVGPAVQVAVH